MFDAGHARKRREREREGEPKREDVRNESNIVGVDRDEGELAGSEVECMHASSP